MADEFANAPVEHRAPGSGEPPTAPLSGDGPKNCAPYGLWFAREVLGVEGILPLRGDGAAIRAIGFGPSDFARAAHADWNPGGFRSLDDAAAVVRDNGGVVLAVVEFRGFAGRSVGAHQMTLFRSPDNPGAVMVREWDGRRAYEYEHEWGREHVDIEGVYGIVFGENGLPARPLEIGEAPSGQAGKEFSFTRVGERPVGESPMDRARLSVGESGRQEAVPVEGERVRESQVARDWVVDQLRERDWRNSGQLDDARVIVSELVANSLRHSTGAVDVLVTVTGTPGSRVLRVEIVDNNPVAPEMTGFDELPDDVIDDLSPDDLDALISGLGERGRGLAMVVDMTDDAGVDERPDGKTTWFELHESPSVPTPDNQADPDQDEAATDDPSASDPAPSVPLDPGPAPAGGRTTTEPRAGLAPEPPPAPTPIPSDPAPVETRTPERHGDVLNEGNLPEGDDRTPLYRGIPRVLPDGTINPAYEAALQGIAIPRGTEDISVEDHVMGAHDRSDSTSWSRVRRMAEGFAGPDGILLEWRSGQPPEGATWRFKPWTDYDLMMQYQQVVIQGTLTGARAERLLTGEPKPDTSAPAATPARSTPATPDHGTAAVLENGTAAEIAKFLRGEYGLTVTGFDHPDVDIDVVREFGAAVHDVLGKFDEITLPEIRITELDSRNTLAELRADPRGRVEWLALNLPFALDPNLLRTRLSDAVAAGRMAPGHNDRPVYSRIVHELGHALDYAGKSVARERAQRVLADHYRAAYPNRPGGYDAWLRQLAGYGFKGEGGAFVPHEAIAEAFADVEVLGPAAPEPAHVLHQLLVMEAQAAAERERRVTDGSTEYRYPGQGVKSHVEGGIPKICAPESLRFAREERGISTIAPTVEVAGDLALHGTDAREMAVAAGADWHPGGWGSLDQAAGVVRDTGATIVGVVEFHGLQREHKVGAHAFVMFQAEGGAVIVHEQVGDEVREFVYTWGQSPRQIAGVYGIVFDRNGIPEHPLAPGQEPSSTAGLDRPIARVGAPIETVDNPANTAPVQRDPSAELSTPPAVSRPPQVLPQAGLPTTEATPLVGDGTTTFRQPRGVEPSRDNVDVREPRGITGHPGTAHPADRTTPSTGRPVPSQGGSTADSAPRRSVSFAAPTPALPDWVASAANAGPGPDGSALAPSTSRQPEVGVETAATDGPVPEPSTSTSEFDAARDRTTVARARLALAVEHAQWSDIRDELADRLGITDSAELTADGWSREIGEARERTLDEEHARQIDELERAVERTDLLAGGVERFDRMAEQQLAAELEATWWRAVEAGRPLERTGQRERAESALRLLDQSAMAGLEWVRALGIAVDGTGQGDCAALSLQVLKDLGADVLVPVEPTPLAGTPLRDVDRAAGAADFEPRTVRAEELSPGVPDAAALIVDAYSHRNRFGSDAHAYVQVNYRGLVIVVDRFHGRTEVFDPNAIPEAVRRRAIAFDTDGRAIGIAETTPTVDPSALRVGGDLPKPTPANNPSAPDIALVRAARGGDDAAYDRLRQRYAEELLRLAQTTVGDRPTAERLVTETFERARRDLSSILERPRPLGPWLNAIAQQVLAQHIQFDRLRSGLLDALVAAEKVSRTGPEGRALTEATRAQLRQGLESLPGDKRRLLVARFWEGRSIEETAAALHLPLESVKTLQRGAVRDLSRYLVSARGEDLTPNEAQVLAALRENPAAARRAIAELPRAAREFAELRLLQQKPLDEVAAVMDRTKPQLSLLKSRAFKALAEALSGDQTPSGTPGRGSALLTVENAVRTDPQSIEGLLDQLSPGEREFTELRFLQGLPLDEVTRRLSSNPQAIKAMQSRATRKLADLLSGGEAPTAQSAWTAIDTAQREDPDRVRQALTQLTDAQRQAVEARLTGQDPADTATAMDRSESAIQGLQRDGALRLAEALSGVRRPVRGQASDTARTALRERPEAVRRAVASLAPDQRRVLELGLLDSLPADEIATAMNRTEGAVGALQRRALRALLQQLENDSATVEGPSPERAGGPDASAHVSGGTTATTEFGVPGAAALQSADPDTPRTSSAAALDAAPTPAALGTPAAPGTSATPAPRARDAGTPNPALSQPGTPVAAGPTPLEAVRRAQRENPDALRDAIAKLPRNQREVAERRFVSEWSILRIGQELGRTEYSVTRLQDRAVTALADLLAGGGPPVRPGGEALTLVRNTQRDDPAALRRLIRDLPPDEAKVIRWRIVQERSIADTAASMRRSEDAVSSLFRKAVQHLADALEGIERLTVAEATVFIQTAQREHPDLLRRAVAQLPEPERTFADLRFVQDRKLISVAAAMRRTENALKGIRERAVTQLADLLSTDLGPVPRAAGTRQRGELSATVRAALRDTPDALRRAIAALPEIDARVLDLRFLQGKSVDETATAIGRSDAAVSAIQRRALRRIPELLTAELDRPDAEDAVRAFGTSEPHRVQWIADLHRENPEALPRAIELLAPDQRQLARLRFLDGRSIADLTDILAMDVFSVYDLQGRTVRTLRHLLADELPPEPERGTDPARAGSAIPEEWDLSGYQTAAQVGAALAERHGLTVTGFDTPGADLETAREYARAVHDVLSAYRWIDLREVRIDDIEQDPPPTSEEEYIPARAYRALNGQWFTEKIVFNTRYATRPQLFADMWAERSAAGHMAGPADRPVYGIIVHELGHALDYAGQHGARSEFLYELFYRFHSLRNSDDMGECLEWAAGELTAYSFFDDMTIDPVEALAEAFAAVHHLGRANATDAQRALHDLLVSEAEAAERRGESPAPDLSDALPSLPDLDALFDNLPSAESDGTDTSRASGAAAEPEPTAPQPESVWDLTRYQTAEEVGTALEQRYADRALLTLGFDTPGVDVETAREYARAIDDMLTAFPTAHIREIRIAPLDGTLFAEADYDIRDGVIQAVGITFNELFAAEPRRLHQMWRADVASGHRVGPVDRPVYANIVHEFGHILDYAGDMTARRQAERKLLEHFATRGTIDYDDFYRWLRTQFGSYNFRPNRTLHESEAVAESFAAVRHLGAAATEGQQVLYRLLLDQAGIDPNVNTTDVQEILDVGPDGRDASRAGDPDNPQPPGPVRIPARPDPIPEWDSGYHEFDRDLDALVNTEVTEAGGRLLNSRVGLVEGENPQIVIVEWQGQSSDSALAEALDRYPELRAALTRPEAEIRYLEGQLYSGSQVRLTELEPPDLWRTVIESGHWAGRAMTYWLDREDFWQSVPLDITPDQVPPPFTESVLPADNPLRPEYAGENSEDLSRFQRVHYLNDAERESTRLFIGPDGRLYSAADGQPFDTRIMLERSYSPFNSERAEFVVDEFGNLYSDRSRITDRFAHSSFLAGDPVAGAGTIEVYHGRLMAMDDRSGHYRPEPPVNDRVLRLLRARGLNTAHGFAQLDHLGAVRPTTPEEGDFGDASNTQHGSDFSRTGSADQGPWDLDAYETAEEVAAGLRSRHGLVVHGFDIADVPVETAREFARAVDQVLTRYPAVPLHGLRIAPLDEGVFAAITTESDGLRSLTLNEQYAIDPDLFQLEWENSDTGAAIVGPLDNPVFGSTVFELGRLVDEAGKSSAQRLTMRELALRYREQHGAIDRPGFTVWLRRQFSFAAFGQFGAFKPAEALAESFAALSHDDGEPSDGHQVLFDLLVRQANPETRAQWPVGDEHELVFFHPDNTDRWGAHDSPTAVAAELAARHGLIVTGFDVPGVSVDTAREFARAIDRLLIEHPRVTLREIAIAPLEPGVLARTLMPVGTRSTQAIVLNERFATDPLLFQHDWAAALESGFCTGPPDRPVYGTIVHEFGHALDAAGDFAARKQVPLLLALRYRELGGDIERYRDWLERQLTRYSMHKDGTVNIGEALAEAFAAMDRDPTTVTEAQRLMYEILLRRSRGDEPTSEREM